MADEVPVGWHYNPSHWSERLPVLGLAVFGCAVACYLTLYQMDVIKDVWEPFFGNGSRQILKESSISHMLPVPDASLGALAYLLEIVLDSLGDQSRWRSRPWIVLLLGFIAGGFAVGGIVLAILQPTAFGAFCTLCLVSAACSVVIAWAVLDEVIATVEYLHKQSRAGHSVWRLLRGVRPARNERQSGSVA